MPAGDFSAGTQITSTSGAKPSSKMVSSEPLLSSDASTAVVVCPFHLCPHDTAGSQHGDESEASNLCGRDNTDKSLIKDCSFGQLADDIPALAAAGWGHVDLFGVSHNPVLQGIQGLVTAHPHLAEDEER